MRSHKDATTDCQPRVTSINDELNSSEAIFIGAGSKAGPARVFNHCFVPVIATLAGLGQLQPILNIQACSCNAIFMNTCSQDLNRQHAAD